MSATWERLAITRQLKDSIVALCKSHNLFGGQLDIDGIVCITGMADGQEMVVKVHERLGTNRSLALTDFLTRPRDGWASVSGSHSVQEDNPEDYSLKRPRLDDSFKRTRLEFDPFSKTPDADSYPNLKQHLMNPSQHPRDMRRDTPEAGKEPDTNGALISPVLDPTAAEAPSPEGSDQLPPVSPTASGFAPYPFTSTPHSVFPRRIPLRTDRWSPNQPVPTVPECKPCGFTFSSFDYLSDHNEAVHSVFTCQSCFKTFTSRSNLERHSRLHTGHRPYNCSVCGKSFSRKDHLTNHATKHAFKCGTCSKRFPDKKMLVSHYSYEHNAVLSHLCELCNKGFSSPEQYDEHLKLHPACAGGKEEDDDWSNMPHNLSMSGASVVPVYSCGRCGFQTADKLTLVKHRLIHQENARCYTCLACSKLFDDPLHYSDHLLMHSEETNIFECCVCRQICPTLTSLRRHEAVHASTPLDEPPAAPALDTDHDESGSVDRGSPATLQATPSKAEKAVGALVGSERREQARGSGVAGQGFACTVCREEFEDYSDICSHIEREGHYVYPAPTPASGSKNKRKQKLPKPAKNVAEEDMDPESDVEIVQPASPPDDRITPSNGDLLPNGDAVFGGKAARAPEFVISENMGAVVEIRPDADMEAETAGAPPIKALLSQTLQARAKDKDKVTDDKKTSSGGPSRRTRNRQNAADKAAATSASQQAPEPNNNNNSSSNNNNLLLSPKLLNLEIPDGPFTCSICGSLLGAFQEFEMHCFSEHNRSPCMFCNKTFAQKANRDRHVCLHTGDKPYSCPDCNEKFSRGDKLKIHRMRAHQTSFPAMSSRKADSGADAESPTAGSPSPGDDWAAALPQDRSDFVAATGEWSVREIDDSGIEHSREVISA